MVTVEPKTVLGILDRVAAKVAASYPPYVLKDDVYSELVVWLYQNKKSIEALIDTDSGWKAKLGSTATKVAIVYAANEKSDAEGQGRESGYLYSAHKLRQLLPDVFNYDDWQTFGLSGDGQPRGKPIVSHGGNRTAELIDIKKAVEDLPDQIQLTLELYYGRGMTAVQVAAETEVPLETAKKRIQRAITTLRKALGPQDKSAYYNRRTVRSNAAWQADTSHDYSGD